MIEELDSAFYGSRPDIPGTPPFPPALVEAPALFIRGGWYYATFGHGCCYCLAGSNVFVYVAKHPLGPYTALGDIGLFSNGSCCVTRAQQNYIAAVNGFGSSEAVQFVWTGTRWGSAPDKRFVHDFQTWLPLMWNDTADPPRPLDLVWTDTFEVKLD